MEEVSKGRSGVRGRETLTDIKVDVVYMNCLDHFEPNGSVTVLGCVIIA